MLMINIRPPKRTTTTRPSVTCVSLIALVMAGLPAAVTGQTTGQLAVVEGLPTEDPVPTLPEVMGGLARDLGPYVGGYDRLKATFDECATAAQSVASSLALDGFASESPSPAGADAELSIAGCIVGYHEGKISLERAIQATALGSEAVMLAQVSSLKAEDAKQRALAETAAQEAAAQAVRRDALVARFEAEATRLFQLDPSSWTRDDTMKYGAFVREASALEMMEQQARHTNAIALRQADLYAGLAQMAEGLGTQVGEWGRDISLSTLASKQALENTQRGASGLAVSATIDATVPQVVGILQLIRDASRSDPVVPERILFGGASEPTARLDMSTPDLGLLADIYARSGRPLAVDDTDAATVGGE